MNEYKDILCRYRRELHRIPETGFDLPKTYDYILSAVSRLKCTVTPAAGAGLCAFFDFGRADTVAFRTDMDALPIAEKTGAAYASARRGYMHACGHDGHMAMMLAFADWLDEQDTAPANALLIFQPAEETTGGAEIICRSGIFEKHNVKCIFGIHLWPELKKGCLSTCPGPMMARSSEINVDIQGRTAHCTAARKGLDAAAAGAKMLLELEAMPQLPETGSILKFGKISGGDVRNAIAASCRLEGTLRCLRSDAFDDILIRMDRIAETVCSTTGCIIEIHHSPGYPPVTNDPALCSRAVDVLGREKTGSCRPAMIAEDFSFYQQKVPGVFFFLGTGTGIALHSDKFDFDEAILDVGLQAYIRLFTSATQLLRL